MILLNFYIHYALIQRRILLIPKIQQQKDNLLSDSF